MVCNVAGDGIDQEKKTHTINNTSKYDGIG
jgi:hypothetical protein